MAKQFRITQAATLTALDNSAGIVATVARRLGCDWSTARRYIDKWVATRQAFADEGNKAADLAESTVLKAIQEGDVGTAKWYLARIRKGKYSERQEVTGADGAALAHCVLFWPEAMPADDDAS